MFKRLIKGIPVLACMLSVIISGVTSCADSGSTNQDGLLALGFITPKLIDVEPGMFMTVQFVNKTGSYSNNEIYVSCQARKVEGGDFFELSPEGAMNVCVAGHNATSYRLSDINGFQIPDTMISARMYFSYESDLLIHFNASDGIAYPSVVASADPNLDKHFDWIEFTVKPTGFWGNTTQVDMMGLPCTVELFAQSGGTDYSSAGKVGISGSMASILRDWNSIDDLYFRQLKTTHGRILSPRDAIDAEYLPGATRTYFSNYFKDYIDALWVQYSAAGSTPGGFVFVSDGVTYTGIATDDTMHFTGSNGSSADVEKPSSQDVWGGEGHLHTSDADSVALQACKKFICAAIQRHVMHNASLLDKVSEYYKHAPTNFYSWMLHRHAVNNKIYGFCYDDVYDQSSSLHSDTPRGIIITLGR